MIFTEFKNTLTRHEIDTAETITKGSLVSLNYTTNKLKAGVSNASNILGIAQESGIAGDFIYVATSGTAEGVSGLISGETCWSNSAGTLFPNSTAPVNNAGYFVGICVSSTEVRIDMRTFTPAPTTNALLLKNYILDFFAEDAVNIATWDIYDDSSAIPIDGAGGTTSISLSANNSSSISGVGDLRVVKTASNLQGEGFSIDFTIENKDLAKILEISFNSRLVSGTYTKGDLRIYIIQDPNGTPVVIEPINVELETGNIGIITKHIASFQTHDTITTYRLCFHIASTSALAYTLDFNNLSVWEVEKNYGSIITGWTSYTPTFQGWGTLSNINCFWRRNGENLELFGRFTAGTSSAVEARMNLPSGLTISSKVSARTIVGGKISRGVAWDVTGVYESLMRGGDSFLNFSASYANPGASVYPVDITPQTGSFMGTGTKTFSFVGIPIEGWGSNILLSSDAGDGRNIVGAYLGHTSQVLTANVTNIRWNTKQKDSHACYNSSTGELTIPVSGDYCISYSRAIDLSGTTATIRLFKNNSYTNISIGVTHNNYHNYGLGILTDLKKGDVITIRSDASGTTSTRSDSQLQWFRIGTSSQIVAQDEKVNCFYHASSNHTSSSTQPIQFNSKIYDSHGVVTTGTAWKFTAPMSGKYLVTGAINIVAGSSYVRMYKNNILYMGFVNYNNSGVNAISVVIDLNQGDYFDLRPATTLTARGGLLDSIDASHIQINKIG